MCGFDDLPDDWVIPPERPSIPLDIVYFEDITSPPERRPPIVVSSSNTSVRPAAFDSREVRPQHPRTRSASQDLVGNAAGRVYVKEFSDPGIVIRIPFGVLASELWSQLRSPSLIRPDGRIDVLVQVYRFLLPLPVEHLQLVEAPLFGEPFEPRVLVPAKARALGLVVESDVAGPAELPLRVAERGQVLLAARAIVDPSDGPGTSSSHDPLETDQPNPS